ncbi:MAG: CPBP family glutamic-type intramembrane protease [Asticcacaulis sp.]
MTVPWLDRLRQCAGVWPDTKGWLECLAIALPGAGLIAAIALPSGVAHWQPELTAWPLRLLKVMLVPVLGEEMIFRGLLIPARGEGGRPMAWIAASLSLFVLWHVIEAVTFLPGAHLFLTLQFLACAACLGVVCTVMRCRTGSLWPGVLFHAAIVFVWQAVFAGPEVAQLMRP